MRRLFINYWRETEDRYCTLFLPFSHLLLVVSTSLSCSRHCRATPPPADRMQSLASQQIMWCTRVLTEDKAMSHKGPLWVPDYDNIRKCRKEEVSAGSWLPYAGLWENHTYLIEPPRCHPSQRDVNVGMVEGFIPFCFIVSFFVWLFVCLFFFLDITAGV